MPRSINYRPTLIDELITNERLNSYASVFSYSDDSELVGAYLWNTHVCSAIYPLLTASEVALRNSIDTALVKDIGRFWWARNRLHYKSFTSSSNEPFEVKAIKNNFSKATDQVRKDKKGRYRIKSATPTHHEIIAKTEFSTWEFILDAEFMGPNLIWPKHLGAVFKGSWPSRSASTMLGSTRDLVKTIREFRNRVSHHEPIWKRYGVHTELDAISHLNEKIDKIMQLVALISPDKEQLLVKNGLLARAKMACSIDELRRYQNLTTPHKVKSISKLCMLAQQSTRDNKTIPVTIYKNGSANFLIQPK
ncbi:Abi family protein [Marinomonas fungiae]|uniref:Abi family protein n=1 Tax=Marinomonas fungiae TaxID=1137284 RepID=UPI003A93790B